MEVYPDFRDLFRLFNAHGVDYAIVGAYALAFHGAPRYTGDIDLLVRPEISNAQRIIAALMEFGLGSDDLPVEQFTHPEQVIRIGVTPVRVDILTSLTGVSWEEVAAHRVMGRYADLDVPYIGREQFIANKRACGRAKDLGDLDAIGEL